MNKELVKQIVSRDLEGYKVSDRSVHSEQNDEGFESMDSVKDNQSESNTPDFRLLRQKYLHEDNLFEATDATESDKVYAITSDDTSGSEQDEIVAVEPETAAHPWDRAARPKAIVISGSEKKVVGEQG